MDHQEKLGSELGSSLLGMSKRFLGLGGSSQPSGIGLGALVTLRNFNILELQKKVRKFDFFQNQPKQVGKARQYNNNERSDKQKCEFHKCYRDDRQTLSTSRFNQNCADLLIRRLTNRQIRSRKEQGSSHRGSFLGCGSPDDGLENGNRRDPPPPPPKFSDCRSFSPQTLPNETCTGTFRRKFQVT